jgi:catechol 2,3-dioxygenase-like lactoylglutathione lyase family enzyme
MSTPEEVALEKPVPVLKLKFISHATLDSPDIERSRRFYEEFLGLEVIRTSHKSLMLRLGGNNTIAVVRVPKAAPRTIFAHNGLDVTTRAEVDECYRLVVEQKDKWGLTEIMQPADLHGTYSFYFRDMDGNWWEILTNPEGGYSWMFKKGADIQNWGWDESEGFNPNDSKPGNRGGVRPKGVTR